MIRPVGPLEGVRVLELGVLIAGPFAGRLLADSGAEVIKVEEPEHGDPLREWGQLRHEGRPLWWPVQSRNKKLITLDLRHQRGRELLLRLAERSDILIENFRPGTLERWGLGPDELWEVNPGLVVARVSGYGQTGPYAGRAGFAVAGEALGGLRHINGYPGQAPPRTGLSLGDSLAAMFAVQGILMALYRRDAGPAGPDGLRRGQVVDASIMESCFAMLESTVPEYGKLGHVRQPSGTSLAGIAPSNVYRSRDQRWIVIGANGENLFRRLCAVMGQPELAADERFSTHWARGRHADELDAIIGAWVGERDAAEVDRLLNANGIVCGPVYTIADIFEDPQYRARELLVEMEDPDLGTIVAPGVVPRLSETPGGARWTGSWQLGRHNAEIYGGLLGLPDAELNALAEEGVI
jgi:crotonobetainyl-CoA:carnitine CoA-transferase CaiB-like acyl-CoA transferase